MISWGKRGTCRVASVVVAAALLAGLVATPTMAADVAGLAGDSEPASSSAPHCGLQPTGGRVTVALVERTYLLYVPQSLADLPPGTAVPLLLSFHGLGGSGDSQADLSGWEGDAETHQFIVAFPNALARVWRSGANSQDVAFARSVVADIQSTYCVDRAHIHADGLSNGAQFTYRLACDAPDLFASYSEISGSEPVTDRSCAPSRPVAISTAHGNEDRVIAIDRDRDARDAWVARNGCDPTPVVEEPTSGLGGDYWRYLGCDGDVEVSWREYNAPHIPDDPTWADYRALSLAFFARYPHPDFTSLNTAPVAVDDSATTDEDTPVTIDVLANDSDPDGDAIAVASVDDGAHGTTDIVDGKVRYTPAADHHGPDTFTYTVTDPHGLTATATVRVTVTQDGTPNDDDDDGDDDDDD